MPSLSTEHVVYASDGYDRDSVYGNVVADVDRIFSEGKHVQFSPPKQLRIEQTDTEGRFSPFDFAGKDIQGTVQCTYAVAGAWNVAAKCELEDEHGKKHMWAGWVFDIRDFSGQDSDPKDVPARFRFCFSRELVTSGSDFSSSLPDVEKVVKSMSSDDKYVCIDGFVDSDEFAKIMADKSVSTTVKVRSAAEKALEESGLFEYHKK